MKIYLLHKSNAKEKRKESTNLFTQIKDLFYPMHCPVCDTIICRRKGLICPECSEIPRRVKEPRCVCCGKHLADESGVRCRDCSGRTRSFEYGVALYEYSSVHDSIYAFKNLGRGEYAEYYGREICHQLMPDIQRMNADALIPIPLHSSKLRKRGYNQAALLAKEIAKGCGLPVREDVLKRIQKTSAQKKMNHADRQNNMKKAFHMEQNDVKLDTVILVDDVFTTGSTIEAAAKELKRGGVNKVFYVALAIGKGLS